MRAWLAAAVLLTLSLAPPQTAQATEVAVTMPNGGAQLQSPTLAVGALGGNSFPGETLVHTRDRQGKPALKPIADIKIGDEVLAWDELAAHDGQEIQAKTGTSAQRISAKRYEKVSDLITSERERKLVHITLEGGQSITATDGHPFRTSEGWRDAVLLKKGAKLLLMGSGEGDADSAGTATTTATATIEDVRIEVKTTRVYNLEVENLHTFFVGEQGLIVHNARRGPPVTQNRDVGKQWEKDVANAINDKGVNRAELGTRGFKTPFGWRFPDIFVYDGGGALIALLECKAGGAKRSRHQRDKDDWIRDNHNVPTIEIGHK